MGKKIKNLLQNFSVLLITLIALFLIGELVSRIYCAITWKETTYIYRYSLNRDIFYEFNPGWEGEFSGVPVKINSLGMRDYEYPLKKDKNTYRILVLGNSMSFGWRLNLEDIFQKILEKKLNKRNSKYNYEVINAAVPGYNLRQEVAYLESNGLKLKPNLVIISVFINDITDFNAKPVRVLPQIPVWSLPCSLSDIPRKSFFFQFIALKWELLIEKYNKKFNVTTFNDNSIFLKGVYNSETSPYWLEFNMQIRKLASLIKENRIRLMLVYWPDVKQFKKGREWQQLQVVLNDIASRNDFYFLDLLPILEKSDEWPLLSEKFPGDTHPNEIGHKLAANAIYKYLVTKQIIP